MKKKKYLKVDLVEKFREGLIVLIDESQILEADELKNLFPGKRIIVCDAYVNGAEKGISTNYGYEIDGIAVIDHHAPIRRFAMNISSTNLAIAGIEENDIRINSNTVVVINHTDADAILAASIIARILPPNRIFADAAIAADHTGEENKIADLLQAFEYKRDIEFSLRNLQLLLEENPLEPDAQKLVAGRKEERQKAVEIGKSERMKSLEEIFYIELKPEEKIDPSFFLHLIPKAEIFVAFRPFDGKPDRWEARIRLGYAGIGKIRLNELGIESFDPGCGFRFNAGSNIRAKKGTDKSPDEYVREMNKKRKLFLGLT